MNEFFAEIKPIQYEGPDSRNPLAFKYYDPDRVVGGRTMKEHLKFSVAYWHTFKAEGTDPFGSATMLRPWDDISDPMDKAKAIEHIVQRRNHRPEEVLFAGDSGNDLSVLASRFPAVLVANADPEVRRAALEASARAGRSDLLYCAQGAAGLGNGNYASGILEGVLHYHAGWSEVIGAVE